MEDVSIILRLENSLTKIVLPPAYGELMKPLREYMSVVVPGYKYSEAYKKRQWDGKKSFIAYGRFGTGLAPMVYEFLTEEYGVPVELLDARDNLPTFGPAVESVGKFELYDYQRQFVHKTVTQQFRGLPWNRGIIDAATNAGKSLMAAGVFASIVGHRKALFLLHSKDLYDQAVRDYGEMFDVGQINAKQCDVREFTIAMTPTLSRMLEDGRGLPQELADVNLLVMDECHHAAADTFAAVVQSVNAGARVFVSGTPLALDVVKKTKVMALSGKVIAKISNAELIDRGVSRRPVVHLHYSDRWQPALLTPLERLKLRTNTYEHEMQQAVHTFLPRAETVAAILAQRPGKRALVSFAMYEHGDLLLDTLRKALPDRRVELSHGQTSNRKQLLEDFRNGKIDVLVASMILKEGINVPNLDILVLAQGGKSVITVKQLVGRALRRKEGESTVEVHDFYDTGKHLEKHSRNRARLYLKEGFELKAMYPLRKSQNRGYIPA